MQASVARLTITGLTPYSQSRQHDEPKLEGETHEAYDVRTWRSKLSVATRNGAATVVIPAHGLRRLSAERATEVIGPNARRHIRKAAGRARKVLIAATEGANDLSPDAQRRRAAEISALGLMEHIARDNMTRPSETASTKPMPVAITAQEFLARIQAKSP